MLYKFKSPVTADLIMLAPHGRRVLGLIGKDGEAHQGILQAAQIPAAVAALEAAMVQEEADQAAQRQEALGKGEDWEEPAGHVSLRQRATPFIEMLRRCQQAGKDVVWGV